MLKSKSRIKRSIKTKINVKNKLRNKNREDRAGPEELERNKSVHSMSICIYVKRLKYFDFLRKYEIYKK